jgi:hypothetical protein
LTEAVPTPLIIPPVSNKMIQGHMTRVWNRALEILRGAKNVIFVGYSFPETDTYVRYFLKAGLGAASNLNKIFVFDPVLFTEGTNPDEMKRRYSLCVADSFQPRVTFRPYDHVGDRIEPGEKGTFKHFFALLGFKPEKILFQ